MPSIPTFERRVMHIVGSAINTREECIVQGNKVTKTWIVSIPKLSQLNRTSNDDSSDVLQISRSSRQLLASRTSSI